MSANARLSKNNRFKGTYAEGLVLVRGVLRVGGLSLGHEFWSVVVSSEASLALLGSEAKSLRRACCCPSDRLHGVCDIVSSMSRSYKVKVEVKCGECVGIIRVLKVWTM